MQKDPQGCGETQVNCLGSLGALAPTALQISGQHILNEATHDGTRALPGRGPSPGSNLMEILKEKSPRLYCFLCRNIEISQTFLFIIPPTTLRSFTGWYLVDTWFQFWKHNFVHRLCGNYHSKSFTSAPEYFCVCWTSSAKQTSSLTGMDWKWSLKISLRVAASGNGT